MKLTLRKIKIFSIISIITIFLFALKKNSDTMSFFENFIIKPISESTRYLLSISQKDKICNKAEDSLIDKYKNFYTNEYSYNGLNKHQKAIVNYIKDQEYKYVKDYFPHIVIFLIIIVIDIIFIFFWISYCVCCCCPRWIFSKDGNDNENSLFLKICYYICLAMYIILIILCIIIIILRGKFSGSLNGTSCSIFKVVFHFIYGMGSDYPSRVEWSGTENLSKYLNESINFNFNPSDISEIENKKMKIDEEYKKLSVLNKIVFAEYYLTFEANYAIITKLPSSEGFDSLFNEIKRIIDELNTSFYKARDGKIQDIYDITEDINKYTKLIFYLFFIIFLILGIVGLVAIFVYVSLYFEKIKILYHIVWNLEMLFMIIGVLFGCVFGIFGYISKDLVPVTKYIISLENLKSNDPAIFDFKPISIEYINICFNGDGLLGEKLISTNDINSFYNNLDEYSSSKMEQIYNSLNSLNVKDEIELKTLLLDGLKMEKNMLDSLYNDYFYSIQNVLTSLISLLNCQFLKSDVNIILSQFKKSLANILITLCALILLCSFVAGLSVFFGIIVINRYGNRQIEKIPEHSKTSIQPTGNHIFSPVQITEKNVNIENK